MGEIWGKESSVKGRACLDFLLVFLDLQPPRESGVGRLVGMSYGGKTAGKGHVISESMNPLSSACSRWGRGREVVKWEGKRMCWKLYTCMHRCKISTSLAHSSCCPDIANGTLRCLVFYPLSISMISVPPSPNASVISRLAHK